MIRQDIIDNPAGSESPREAEPINRRPIRSFTLRQGRLTDGQQKALESLWPLYGLDSRQPLDKQTTFGRDAPLILEIGFGNGESLAQMAAAQPENDYLGIEVHRPGVGHLLLKIDERCLTNVRIYNDDAMEMLSRNIRDASLAGVNLFFPDPWPKKRHHKRRLVNPDFIKRVASKLERGGFFHAATDWEDYAQHMLSVLGACPELENREGGGAYAPRPDHRPLTKFESRGQRLGHGVWDLVYIKR